MNTSGGWFCIWYLLVLSDCKCKFYKSNAFKKQQNFSFTSAWALKAKFFSFHAHEMNLDLKAVGCALSLAKRVCKQEITETNNRNKDLQEIIWSVLLLLCVHCCFLFCHPLPLKKNPQEKSEACNQLGFNTAHFLGFRGLLTQEVGGQFEKVTMNCVFQIKFSFTPIWFV